MIDTAISIHSFLLSKGLVTIPLYQRTYAWKEKNILDFLILMRSSLENELQRQFGEPETITNLAEFYIGPVITATENTSGKNIHYIVDGQQRISTYIFFNMCFIMNLKRLITSNEDYTFLEQRCNDYFQETFFEDTRNFIARLKYEKEDINKEFSNPGALFDKFRDWSTYPENEDEIELGNLTGRSWTPKLKFIYNYIKKDFITLIDHYLTKNTPNTLDQKNTKISNALKVYQNQIKISEVNTTSYESAFIIFENFNSKGEPLSGANLIKNQCMMIANSENTNTYNFIDSYFTALLSEGNKGIKDVDATKFFRAIWNSKIGFTRTKGLYSEVKKRINILDEEDGLKGLKKIITGGAANDKMENVTKFVEMVEEYTAFWNFMSDNNSTEEEKKLKLKDSRGTDTPIYENLKRIRFRIKRLGIEQYVPLAMNVMKKASGEYDSPDKKKKEYGEFIKFLESIELNTIMRALFNVNPTGLEEQYSRYSVLLEGNIMEIKQIINKVREDTLDIMHQSGESGLTDDQYKERFRETLKNYIFSTNVNIAKVMLLNEMQQIQFVKAALIDKKTELEHMAPQKPQHPNKIWEKGGEDKHLNSIGNYTLLPKSLNSSVSNGTILEKYNDHENGYKVQRILDNKEQEEINTIFGNSSKVKEKLKHAKYIEWRAEYISKRIVKAYSEYLKILQ